MHGSVSTLLNIYSFADQRTSYCEQTQHFCRQRTCATTVTFHWSVYCQIYEAFCWMCNTNRLIWEWFWPRSSIIYCKTWTWHTVVWKVEQRSPNKVSNKLVLLLFLPFMRNIGWKVIWCCVSMCPFLPSPSHSCVYCPHGSEISLPSFHSRITRHVGGFYVHLGSSPRAKNCSLCVLSFSFCSSPAVYCNIYLPCLILNWGQRNMRLLLGYCKISFQRLCIKWFASGFAWEFRGYYTILFPKKLLLSLKRHFSLVVSHFFTSWCFFYCFLKRNLVRMHLLRMSLKSSLSCVFAFINIHFLKCTVCVGTYQTHWPFLQ